MKLYLHYSGIRVTLRVLPLALFTAHSRRSSSEKGPCLIGWRSVNPSVCDQEQQLRFATS